jgi:ATP phosphoribosyltransferase
MPFTIALPKGRLGEEAESVLVRSKLMDSGLDRDSRKLIFEKGALDVLLVRAWDVPAYVEMGTADIGICGKDDLVEHDADVMELLDLGFGGCRMTVSAKKGATKKELFSKSFVKVATKYPTIAKKFFSSISTQAEIIKLYGSVELAAVTGMCDCIVDIVSTGATLRENGLEVIEDLFQSTARVIVNRASYYRNLSGIGALIDTVRKSLK